MTIDFISACLFVKNIKVSRRFYEEFLEQKVEIDHGLCVRYKGGFSIWQMSHAYKSIYKDCVNFDSQTDCRQLELYFEVTDLEGIHKRMSELKMEFIHDIQEQSWGQRVFRVYDPDRNIVELSEPINTVIKRLYCEGMTIEEVSKKTSIQLNLVQDVLLKEGIKF